jgi:hypothetical protein
MIQLVSEGVWGLSDTRLFLPNFRYADVIISPEVESVDRQAVGCPSVTDRDDLGIGGNAELQDQLSERHERRVILLY